jgi:hypothetical protein
MLSEILPELMNVHAESLQDNLGDRTTRYVLEKSTMTETTPDNLGEE